MGIPVSMVGYAKVTKTAISIFYVYTPPYYRGKGYATSCVAQISQMALDIYRNIGYKAVCDSLMVRFE